MTNIESRLRSELSPPLPSPNDPESDSHGWNQIERRVDQRHRAQRAGLGVAVLAVGAAVVAALATSNTADGRSAQPATDSIDALRASPWSATVVGLIMVLGVAALGGAAVWAWGRQEELGPVPTITAIGIGSLRPPRRIIGMLIMAAGLAYPMWTYVTHVRDVDQLVDRVPHLDGFETISAERSWNPFV
ncbi:MAG: hypothetical protein GY929_07970, partial [Actinomycetia bacterium]|nr:hypothetical protein [Actinomycetes bacterium]MCP5026209.1 hypothetical protein [Actinomycetes bacterium]